MNCCRDCGAELPADAAFCPRCGARQQPASGLETITRMIEDFRRRLDQSPTDANARFNLALAYRRTGADDLAVQQLELIRGQGVVFADAEYQLALAYSSLGRAPEALAAAQRALDIEPEHLPAQRLLRALAQRPDQRS